MSEEDSNEQDDPELGESGARDQSRRFRLRTGLRPLSDLLGNLIDLTVSESPPSPEDPVDWTAGDENDRDPQQWENKSERKRVKRIRKDRSNTYLVDTRFDDDEFAVTVDIPGASKDDLSVGINPTTNQLVIGKEGAIVERVDLPWKSPETTMVWFNNGVLEVRLRPGKN